MRIGIIGLGKMGLLHASLLSVNPSVELVGLCDKSAIMGRIAKKVFGSTGVFVTNDLDRLVDVGLDAVYITTPISSHAPIVRKLLTESNVRNIFVEKTLAFTYPQSKEICDLAKPTNGINMVGYMKRFSVVFGKAKSLLEDGVLGEPQSFKAYAYSSDFLGITNESKSSSSRGGALRDIGCHIIDLTMWLIGELNFLEVLSMNKDELGSEVSVSFAVRNSSGLKGSFDVSQSMPNYRMPEFGISIECSNGKLEVNDDRIVLNSKDSVKNFYRADLNDSAYFSIGEAEYFREDACFVDSLLGKGKCAPSFEAASKVDLMIDQAREGGQRQ
jgi:predicted dehydrogenase